MDEQKKIEFIPTPEMLIFAEAYVMHRGNISAACAQIGDPHRNLYYGRMNKGWHYQEGFEEFLSDYAKRWVLKRTGRLYLIAIKYAEKGSFQHWNTLMQIAKEFSPKEVDITNIIRIESVRNEIRLMSDKDLEAIIVRVKPRG
jgi:hypothetical protein